MFSATLLVASAQNVQAPALDHGSDGGVQAANGAEAVPFVASPRLSETPQTPLAEGLSRTPMQMNEILKEIQEAIGAQLRSKHGQWINAAVALVVGLTIVYDGDLVFKLLVVVASFAVSSVFAMNEINAFWGLGPKDQLAQFVSVEVGAIAAYTAYKGVDGIMTVLAIGFGAFCASGLQQVVALQSTSAAENHKFVVYLYSAAILISMMMMRKGRMLAIVSAMMGGLLVSSSALFFATFAATHGYMDWFNKFVPGLEPPREGPWVDFVSMLCGYTSEDYGILGGKYVYGMPADRLIGRALWMVVAECGILLQMHRLQRRRYKIVAAREIASDLEEPLL